jgi:SAM-dependent methyltransferase
MDQSSDAVALEQPDDQRHTGEAGSFRDRNGRIYYRDGVILRGVSAQALADWEALAATTFFPRAVADGELVATRLLDSDESTHLAELGDWAGVLEHERIPFVSYPYEWSFGQLKDAAILHLELLIAALDEQMTLKDGSAYNVQWRGTKPVFIDIPSFERLKPGEPWVGYRQFCQLFLFPLFMRAYLGTSYHPWLRGSLDGIAIYDFAPLLSLRDLFRAGIFKHAYLQSRLQARYADSDQDVRQELRDSKFGAEMIRNNARGLLKLVRRLEWKQDRSEWADYASDNSYSENDDQHKKRFIRDVARERQRGLVWDLGSNTGTYSRIAAEYADYVLALDIDHLAVERLYRSLKSEGNTKILPLVSNLADPSPALGWRLQERKPLVERGTPDLVLCLALIHHMVITANVPMEEFVGWLATLGGDLVIEFVTRDDTMVKRLLRNKDDQYTDYNLEHFERCLARRFAVERRDELSSGSRILYFARSRCACD